MSRTTKRKAKNRLPDNGISFVKNDAAFHPGDEEVAAADDTEHLASRPSRQELRNTGAIALKKEAQPAPPNAPTTVS